VGAQALIDEGVVEEEERWPMEDRPQPPIALSEVVKDIRLL